MTEGRIKPAFLFFKAIYVALLRPVAGLPTQKSRRESATAFVVLDC